MNPIRLFAALAAALVAAPLYAASASAQPAWPSKPITLIVPYAAGGNVDIVARWIAPELGKRLGQQVVIENLAGAGGAIGTDRAARAAPDGHTLLLGVESNVLIAKMVSPTTVKYDGIKDFAPITLVSSAPLVLVGKPELPASNLDELLQLLRAHPDKYSYATSGIGTSLHLAGEIFNQAAGTQVVHVPYKVGAQIVTDLAGNQIDLAMLPIPLTSQQVKAGKVKAFVVTSNTRSPALPDVPATSESPALKDVDVTVWFGLFAPARTDAAIVERVHREVADVLKDPGLRQKFADIGMQMLAAGPQEFAQFLQREQQKFAAIVKARNIKAE